MIYFHTSRATTGDGKTILSPAWVGLDGKFITYVDSQESLDATPENIRKFGESVILTLGLMNIRDHISRKSLRSPAPGKTFGECATKLMSNGLSHPTLHDYVNMLNHLKDEGITYVRDQGLIDYTCINLRQATEEGFIMGPYISSCGISISITGGYCYRQSVECDGPDVVRRAVRIQRDKGADVIKFMGSDGPEHFPQEGPSIPQFTLEELRAGTNAAHDLDRDCAIHAHSSEGIRRAVLAGIDHIEYGCMMIEDLIEEMAKCGTHLNPTMTGIRGAAEAGPNAKYWDMLQERVFSRQEQGMRWAKVVGILIGADTDTAGTLCDETAMTVDTLGEGPVGVIGRATGTSARIARCDDMGLLEVGRFVNIAAFDGDLTESLDGLARVAQTWKDGTTCR